MEKIIEIFIDVSCLGERLDKVIKTKSNDEITRSYAQKLIKDKCVQVDGRLVEDKNYKVQLNQIVRIFIPEPEILNLKPENIPLEIIYEDTDILVVNKPKGLVVHPASGNYSGTLVNALMYHCRENLSNINGIIRPGIVHRIDKDTSGLLMVAKNDFSHKMLSEQIKKHSFLREYESVVYGTFKDFKGTINAPIGRHKYDRKKMAVIKENSKNAITHYKVLKQYNGFAHVRLKLETGRTHQIRVHMAYIGHPVAGDKVYGPRRQVIKRLSGQCLHAKYIGFLHPRTLKYLEFESDLPPYFKNFLRTLSFNMPNM